MECIAVIAVSAALIFVRLAIMQELNPFLWGFLAIVVYVAPPVLMIKRGASLMDAPWVWASSFIGLFILFIAQAVVGSRKRFQGRGGSSNKSKAGLKPKKKRPNG